MLISHGMSSRNQSNGGIAEEDIDMISHHIIRPMISCRILSSCMIKWLIDFFQNTSHKKTCLQEFSTQSDTNEHRHEKTRFLHMRKQKRRSASR